MGRIAELLSAAGQELKIETGRLGFEGGFEFVAPSHMAGEVSVPSIATLGMLRGVFSKADLQDATGFLRELRAIKTPREIERLRLASQVGVFGLAAFAESVIPGRKETEVAAAIEAAIYERGVGWKGAHTARGWAHVMSGPRTDLAWQMYLDSTPRVIREGDIVLVELGVVVDGFWADLTRTRVAGQPDSKQLEIHRIIAEAQAAAMAAMRPGTVERDVDAAARRVIEKAGYGKYFRHQTGHGIGFRYRESIPSLHPDCTESIAAGMVSSCEPGIYIPGWGGIRIEDIVVVTDNGTEYLSDFDRSLA